MGSGCYGYWLGEWVWRGAGTCCAQGEQHNDARASSGTFFEMVRAGRSWGGGWGPTAVLLSPRSLTLPPPRFFVFRPCLRHSCCPAVRVPLYVCFCVFPCDPFRPLLSVLLLLPVFLMCRVLVSGCVVECAPSCHIEVRNGDEMNRAMKASALHPRDAPRWRGSSGYNDMCVLVATAATLTHAF